MNIIPKELYLGILSYLDVSTEVKNTSQLETLKVIEAFPLELTNNDWIYLFTLRFPRWYKKSLYHLNTKEIYLELLIMEPILYDLTDSGNVSNPEQFPQALKYLMLEGFIREDTETIAELDDVDLLYLKHVRQDLERKIYATNKLDDDIIVFFYENSINILKYIFEHKLYDENNTKKYIMEAYENGNIKLYTTELIFKYINFNENELIGILLYYESNDMNSYNYIFDKLPEYIDPKLIGKRLTDYSEERYVLDNFVPLWDKYNSLLLIDDIIEIYQNFIYHSDPRVQRQDDLLSLITLIAQHQSIKNMFLPKMK